MLAFVSVDYCVLRVAQRLVELVFVRVHHCCARLEANAGLLLSVLERDSPRALHIRHRLETKHGGRLVFVADLIQVILTHSTLL